MASIGRIVSALGFAKSSIATLANASVSQLCYRCHQGLLSSITSPWQQSQQVRGRYVDWRMFRDVKRRRLVKEYAPTRARINAIRKNKILPREIQEIADKEIADLPRDSTRFRLVDRCAITSRPRGVQQRWRVSRIIWRHLADYNKLSGVTRAWW